MRQSALREKRILRAGLGPGALRCMIRIGFGSRWSLVVCPVGRAVMCFILGIADVLNRRGLPRAIRITPWRIAALVWRPRCSAARVITSRQQWRCCGQSGWTDATRPRGIARHHDLSRAPRRDVIEKGQVSLAASGTEAGTSSARIRHQWRPNARPCAARAASLPIPRRRTPPGGQGPAGAGRSHGTRLEDGTPRSPAGRTTRVT